MKALALDTSSNVTGLALHVDGVDTFEVIGTGRSHSRDILPGIETLLTENGVALGDLDALVYAKGPGSFTGLRITVGVVQGLAFGLDIPVVPVSTLACLAQREYRLRGVEASLVAVTAREDELFFGAYRIIDGIATLSGQEGLCRAGEFPLPAVEASWSGCGDGWTFVTQIEASLGHAVEVTDTTVTPEPADLLAIGLHGYHHGLAVSAMEAEPEYLREQVATPK